MVFYIKRHLPMASWITQEYLKEILDYDFKTGIFTWKFTHGNVKKGNRAGYNSNGYRQIQLGYQSDCRTFKEHRLAFLYMIGRFPDSSLVVDHINGEKDDNRWCNLREVTQRENMQNCKSYKQRAKAPAAKLLVE